GDGVKIITAKATDTAGQDSPTTSGYEIVLDTTAPEKPVFTAKDDEGRIIDPIASGSMMVEDTTPTLFGTGEIGAFVTIYDNFVPIDSIPVDQNGDWTWTPSTPLSEDFHSLIVTLTDPAGNMSDPSDALDFVIGMIPSNRIWDDYGPVTGDIPNYGITDDTTPTFSGTGAAAGDVITIYVDNEKYGSVTVDSSGNWSYSPTLTEGGHAITLTTTDGTGNEGSPSNPFYLTVDTQGSLFFASEINSIEDDDGAESGIITADGNDDAFHLSGDENDMLIYRLLDTEDKTGGNAYDPIADFEIAPSGENADAEPINLRDLLDLDNQPGFTGSAETTPASDDSGAAGLNENIGNLEKYLNATNDGNNTVSSVDLDSAGITHAMIDPIAPNNSETDLATLLTNQQLVLY
ncbi:Ig-like domain-containing protein, partial [Desulfosarcina sp. OttesenSCG-928-G17]|nr:Ig-like domain-containing protein [Desulfosarcina sp. OttesenSCG-928-G17]